MRFFYYVHTGHRIGLDRFHRAVALMHHLQESMDITLLCSDFRIAGEARNYGIKRAVGIDVVRNIPQIAHHGDKMIFDSSEANPIMLEDMSEFFSTFIRISDNPNEVKHPKEFLISPYLEGEKIGTGLIVHERYQEVLPKTIPLALFFGDDDYEKDLEANQAIFAEHKMDLLMGYYHFMGYEKVLAGSFETVYESEEYDEVIRHSAVLVTCSPMAALQSLAGGGRPIYLQRPDYPRDFIPLFASMGIPVVDGYDKQALSDAITSNLSQNYHPLSQTNTTLVKFVESAFNLV